ncbi:DUF6361 family protein [Rhodoplanes sp. Z2-YC6860]|uniref:DUF6361 family protein n=1 Tax=Rhodoplanes sp. Z2-YC6860 TaxID=674703 RepID=UPI00078B40A8|nr:DUF6361 family protein [Rhodoplanes sp. Z2-YC6860]AMN39050.1 hypothetical protein RHPLAN_05850 [Rhodoplanes sp. Z2-YC6860]
MFTWVDFAEDDRRKMSDVIALFSEKDTRDELGLGGIRDTFADLLFPSTSTIQTRARYFLFIPWIYQELERRRTLPADIERLARRDEIRLIHALEDGGETDGIIGTLAQDKLARLPSSIYWAGLGRLGVRRFAGSQEQYHREFTAFYPASGRRLVAEDEQSAESASWSSSLPPSPSGVLERTTFTLDKREAKYLAERIWEFGPTVYGELLSSSDAEFDSDFVWETTFAAKLGPSLKSQIAHAQNFSELMHGAALLYNFMLACDANRKRLQDEYRDELRTWAELVEDARARYVSWDRKRFWAIVSESMHAVSPPTRKFVDRWIDHTLRSAKLADIADDPTAQSIITAREAQVKRTRKRLGNVRALERWNEASGAGQIDYRWFRVKTIANDIRQGLG